MPSNKGEMNATKREPRKKDVVVEEDSENGELLLFSRNFQDTHRSISSRQMHLATLSSKYTVRRLIYYPIGSLAPALDLSVGEIDSSLCYV
jgi:hypothetical protein